MIYMPKQRAKFQPDLKIKMFAKQFQVAGKFVFPNVNTNLAKC